ncbi:putative bifunctional diguanylate cyclase/phosphodiesterase [Phyllobacterium leguminum]|uniref:PAS domain S-box-containing protein/diguanylate cyclase (GGDEF)-like protein n=1 Tax=Phyllobacterium leguminum TaxID=314237 RepID=A0A318T6W6_9HYPH|nr:EAL domain-containing protein [Phyllobacterium leguminum]PYE90192.1 PAS domain S-box-containing protein/diguanylate cyclase (GGDEF)-like protein [Phyllobacterium leguminum]
MSHSRREPTPSQPEEAINLPTEFEDVRYMLHCWQAARINTPLPSYEDFTLGNMGRFADEIAVIHCLPGKPPRMLRAGKLVRSIIGLREGASPDLLDMPFVFRQAIASAIGRSRHAGSPSLALCRWLIENMVSTVEIVAFPLSCRWNGEYFLLTMRQRKAQLDLPRLLINASQQGIVGLSPVTGEDGIPSDFYILSINDAAARFLGAPPEHLQFTLLSQTFMRLRIGDMPERLLRAARGELSEPFELTYELEGNSLALQAGVNSADGILTVTLTDIRELKSRVTLFRSLFDDNPAPMYVRALGEEAFLNVNDAALRLYGYEREAFLNLGMSDITVEASESGAEAALPETALRHRTANGRVLEVIEYSSEVMVEGRPATLSTIMDITERRRAEAHVTYLAHHDPLTGAANRTVFTREIERAAAKLSDGGRAFGVLMIDLDDFKVVNDTLGHAAGDAVLVEVTKRLKTRLREADIVARLGGDEFAILAPGLESREQIEVLAHRIGQELALIASVKGRPVRIGASIGGAVAPIDATEADDLLRCADLALYRAKSSSKGVVRFFEPEMDVQVSNRRSLEMDMRNADVASQFEAHFQPILSVQSGKLCGFEALMRWRHPTRGMVSPAEFIPIAEETGQIDRLGRWMLREACVQAASWPDPLMVAVNVSPVQFRSGGLFEAIEDALRLSGLAPSRLEVEITESVLLADSAANLGLLRQLRDHGVRIALDDFGTGYSSLHYLKQFPFNRLKIDRSFVREIDNSPESLAIVRAIIGLGASLGIDTTAEGVETTTQLERLRAEQCGELQGFLFSPPVAPGNVADIIGEFFGER